MVSLLQPHGPGLGVTTTAMQLRANPRDITAMRFYACGHEPALEARDAVAALQPPRSAPLHVADVPLRSFSPSAACFTVAAQREERWGELLPLQHLLIRSQGLALPHRQDQRARWARFCFLRDFPHLCYCVSSCVGSLMPNKLCPSTEDFPTV